jgi:hypothetical protein
MNCQPEGGGERVVSQGKERALSDNSGYPPVDEDATDRLRASFDRIYAPEKKRLVKLLASANKKGMGLANYKGAPGDAAAVLAWLVQGW